MKIVLILSIFLSILFLTSCGSDSSPTAAASSSSASSVFPSGLAISQAFVSSAASDALQDEILLDGPRAATITSGLSMTAKTAALATVVAAASDAACQVTLPTVTASETGSPSCYGTMLDYKNHINHLTGDADATYDSTVQNNASEDDGRLPTGDLGLWVSSDTGTGNACAAAKLNSLISFVGDKVDYGLLLGASMNCVMTRNSTALPAIGATATVTTALNTALTVNNPSISITAATLKRLADVGTNAVYLYTITTADASDSTKTNTFYIKHMSTSSGNATYLGKMYATLNSMTGGSGGYVYSILYEKTSTNINYKMLGANTNNGQTIANAISTNGDVAIDATSSTIMSGNITQFIANLSSSNGTGNISYSWQAGVNDDATRVFNANSSVQSSLVSGCGFFGYGGKFNFSTSALPTNAIATFICNWAGPNNSHTGLTGKSQKQCVLENSTTHKFEIVTGKEKITYAPLNTCDYNGTDANPAAGNFNFGIATNSSTWGANFDHATNKHASVTNDLVTLSSDTDFSTYTAPTAPTDTLPNP